MSIIDQLQRLIIEKIKETEDQDLLDLVYKLLIAEAS